MTALEKLMAENEIEVITAVLNTLPAKFVQSRIVEKNEEEQIRIKERQLSSFDKEVFTELVDPEKQIEIVNGKVEIKAMAGAKSGGLAGRVFGELYIHVKANKLGRLYTPDTTFMMGKNQRMPDVSFVPTEKIPKTGEPAGRWKFAPDLAVEVVSPSNTVAEMRARLNDFFAAEVREAWLVEPTGVLSVYHNPLTPTQTLTRNETLKGSLVLPDLELDLSEIFVD